jgi:hypothetical protein
MRASISGSTSGCDASALDVGAPDWTFGTVDCGWDPAIV